MSFPSFGRLSRLYAERMMRLFHGGLFDMMDHPELGVGPEFRAAAWKVAQGMAREASKANATSWREAAMKSTRAREIFEALKREINSTGIDLEINRIAARNARLISSLPSELAQHISSFSAKQHLAGKRPEEVAREIRKYAPQLAKSKIRMIARTETSKAETDLTRARSERIGADWYQWETSEDVRVRESHKNMDKVLVNWSDPPSPEALVHEDSKLGHYQAGQAPNCRCIALPLISLDEVAWPCKVYANGKIARMSRAQFTKVIGVRLAA